MLTAEHIKFAQRTRHLHVVSPVPTPERGRNVCVINVHARLICSHTTSAHDQLISISSCSCSQHPLLMHLHSVPPHSLIPTYFTLTLLHPRLALSHTHVPLHMYMVYCMSPDYSPIQRSVAPRSLLFKLAYCCVLTPFTVMLSALDILHRWVGHGTYHNT